MAKKPPRLLQFEIPVPPHSGVLEQYLALGWYKLEGNAFFPPRLKWPGGLGSPMHPGEVRPEPNTCALQVLEPGFHDRLMTKLPNPAEGPEFVEISVNLTVRYQRVEQSRGGRRGIHFHKWEPIGAAMVVGEVVGVK